MHISRARHTGVVVAALLAATVGWTCGPDTAAKPNPPQPPQQRPVSGATRLSALTVAGGQFTYDDVLVQQILDTAQHLASSNWDLKHDRIDQRRLLTGDCAAFSNGCEPGAFVRIVPRKGSHLTKPSELGKGHIVAKLVTMEPSKNIVYQKLGLYTGTSEVYWWVGVRHYPAEPRIDTVSIYVPTDWNPQKPAMWRSVSMMATDPNDPAFRHHHSMARFVWNDNDDETWVTCVSNGCCQPPAAFDSTLMQKKSAIADAP